MKKISFEDPPKLKNSNDLDSSFVEFVGNCLIKDPKFRPDAAELLIKNKKFFSFVKSKSYIRDALLKGMPSVDERVN